MQETTDLTNADTKTAKELKEFSTGGKRAVWNEHGEGGGELDVHTISKSV